MYGFYYIHYGFNNTIFGGEADVVFSGNAGSIENYYQMMVMYDFSRSGRTSDLAHLFNIWSAPQYLVHYIDHLFFEWFMEGLTAEILVRNIIEGYNDKTIQRLKVIVSKLFYFFLKVFSIILMLMIIIRTPEGHYMEDYPI